MSEPAASNERVRSSFPTGHIPVLDGVRGAAIALVVWCHFSQNQPARSLGAFDRLYFRAAWAGWTGVDLFFVLSGFLITGILLDTLASPSYFRSFYVRRVLRIFPLYYGSLAVLFFLVPAIFPEYARTPQFTAVRADQPWFWAYASNLLVGFRGTYLPLINHYWSLAVEEQFYLMWPLAVFAAASPRAVARMALAIMVVALGARCALVMGGARFVSIFHLTFTRMDTLAAGALVAACLRDVSLARPLRRWSGTVAVGSGLLLSTALVFRERFAWLFATFGFTALALFFAALLVQVITGEWRPVRRLFDNAPMRFLGKYSYGMYVIHIPIAAGLSQYAFNVAETRPILGSYLPAQAAFLALGLLATSGVALVLWHGFERWFIGLKRLFPY